MRPRLISVILLFAGAAPVYSEPKFPPSHVGLAAQDKADGAFQKGIEKKTQVLVARRHFAEAAAGYREAHRLGARTPSLYLKLGNAATLADRWPEAIWAYHQGLRLDPNDKIQREHLEFVRAKVIYPPANLGRPEADIWPAWLYRPSQHEFVLIGAIAYLLMFLIGTIAWVRSSLRLFVIAGFMLLITAGAAAGYWHAARQADINRDTPLVILTQNTPFQRGNSTSYPQHPILPLLPRGMELRRLHTRGSWLQVRLTSGEVGWIPASAALVVEP